LRSFVEIPPLDDFQDHLPSAAESSSALIHRTSFKRSTDKCNITVSHTIALFVLASLTTQRHTSNSPPPNLGKCENKMPDLYSQNLESSSTSLLVTGDAPSLLCRHTTNSKSLPSPQLEILKANVRHKATTTTNAALRSRLCVTSRLTVVQRRLRWQRKMCDLCTLSPLF
jgi:hypothetical protein